MKKRHKLGSGWHPAVLALAALLMLANGGPASAGSGDAGLDSVRAGTYAGFFVGFGPMDNRFVDVEGFANWGHPGWIVDYDDAGFVGGVLAGKRFEMGGVPLRIELDGTFGDMSGKTNQLDPEGLDETAELKLRWMATARAGVEHTVGRATLFATGGLAVAGMDRSVIDIDFGRNMPPRVDPDDSFRDRSTEVGWVIGVGVELPLADAWSLRLDGSYLDFGSSTHEVNHSGNNSCGPGNPRRPCPYEFETRLRIVRLVVMYRFRW